MWDQYRYWPLVLLLFGVIVGANDKIVFPEDDDVFPRFGGVKTKPVKIPPGQLKKLPYGGGIPPGQIGQSGSVYGQKPGYGGHGQTQFIPPGQLKKLPHGGNVNFGAGGVATAGSSSATGFGTGLGGGLGGTIGANFGTGLGGGHSGPLGTNFGTGLGGGFGANMGGNLGSGSFGGNFGLEYGQQQHGQQQHGQQQHGQQQLGQQQHGQQQYGQQQPRQQQHGQPQYGQQQHGQQQHGQQQYGQQQHGQQQLGQQQFGQQQHQTQGQFVPPGHRVNLPYGGGDISGGYDLPSVQPGVGNQPGFIPPGHVKKPVKGGGRGHQTIPEDYSQQIPHQTQYGSSSNAQAQSQSQTFGGGMNGFPQQTYQHSSGQAQSQSGTMNTNYDQQTLHNQMNEFLEKEKSTTTDNCKTNFLPPSNARVKCQSDTHTCKATCLKGYLFPHGDNKLYLRCIDNEWVVENSEWKKIPDCEPVCSPPCNNAGICISPGKCKCPESYYGPRCDEKNQVCLSKPVFPKNAGASCRGGKECSITCMKGFKFPDGSTIADLHCVDGKWIPKRSDLEKIPDCSPTCDPPCQNGGKCLSYNTCQCAKEFRGPQCQYNVDRCSPKKMAFNGAYNCSGGTEFLSCSLRCPATINFEFSPASVYTCYFDKGFFVPTNIPQCVIPEGMTLISGQESVHSSFEQGRVGGHTQNQYSQQTGEDEDEWEEIITTIRHKKPKSKSNTIFYEEENMYDVPGIYSLYIDSDIDVQLKSPTGGICVTWGGANVKTFDGVIYNSPLYCSHTLVQDYIDGTFNVILKSCPPGLPETCPHTLKIFLQNIEYTFVNDGGIVKLFTPKKSFPIPVQIMGMKVTPVAQDLKIDLEAIGLVINWDTQRFVALGANGGLWNRTAGLCGTLDKNPRNDFMSRDGVIITTPKTFVDSWKVKLPDEQEQCNMDLKEEYITEAECDEATEQQAFETCQKLLSNPKLENCLKLFDKHALMRLCYNNYCNCPKKTNRASCVCETLSTFAKECLVKKVKMAHGWRDLDICPIHCHRGRMYMSCGPSFQPTCGSVVIPEKYECTEGCFCPEGTVLHNNECIPLELCTCSLRNKEFKPGSKIKKECNTCTCENGKWTCTDITCAARCGAIGDPHYQTFDGKKYDFMGKCSYYLMKTDNLTIEAENVACPGSISEAMNFAPVFSVDMPSCTKSVTINFLIDGYEICIKLRQGRLVYVNNDEVTRFPKMIGREGFVKLRQASSTMISVDFIDGVRIWWDGMTRVYIDVPATYRDKTKGLCGTFNSNTLDDFLTPEGDIESVAEPFADKWKTKESCDYLSDSSSIPHPCQVNVEKKAKAEKLCSKLTSEVFENCHWSVDPDPFYEDCIYDVCACQDNVASCFCPILAAYGAECTKQGIITSWRHSISECAMKCPAGQIYDECGDSCVRACEDIASKHLCRGHCVEGCRCPPGQYLNDQNECIPEKLCSCTFDGYTFDAGYKEVRPGRMFLELCTCSGGAWQCIEAQPGDDELYPPASEVKTKCAAKPHSEFTKCLPSEPKTCKNMHEYKENLQNCRPGCACKEGYVLDTVVKLCVKPENCSCHHGGRSYTDGDKIKEDCNTCICKAGAWDCTTKICAASCSVWGDSHFSTFDNKEFDFQGACDYVLAKGSLPSGDGFTVAIQNVLCGSLGVTCSKSVQVSLTGSLSDTLTLSSDPSKTSSLQKYKKVNLDTPNAFTVYNAGVFTVIEVPGLGLQVKWDRGTRVYVKLSQQWKNKVNGLCGNYNGDQQDDMKTPSHGIETSALLFGHSWKMQEFCSVPTEPIDACKEHPERKTWAQRKCGILKSHLFQPCHSEVPVEKYLKRCTFDTCACDQGGDCECLCTAVAAYASECANKGISIKWRSQHFCPMQCDGHCSEYNECVPSCPVETCDNFLEQGQSQRMCLVESCLEGCAVRPCAEGKIYLNDSFLECVPKAQCKPVCLEKDGITYYEGDIMQSDNCHTCRCSRNNEVCSGVPCSTTPQPFEVEVSLPTEKPSHAEQFECTSGWSDWINTDEGIATGIKGRVVLKENDIEPLPKNLELHALEGFGSCLKKYMAAIECRIVGTHKTPKESNDNAECTLEKGLFCIGSCNDYEIRVFCDCERRITTPREIIFTTKPRWTIPKTTEFYEIIDFITKKPPVHEQCDPTIPHINYPGDCYKFLHCMPQADGSWQYVEKTCGPSMMYNPISMTCDHITNVVQISPFCGYPIEQERSPQTTYIPPYFTEPGHPATSAAPPYGITYPVAMICDPNTPSSPVFEDCHRFKRCLKGPDGVWELVEETCGPDLMFNPITNKCDHIRNVIQIMPKCSKPLRVEQMTTPATHSSIKMPPSPLPPTGSMCDPAIPHIEFPGDCYKFLHCSPKPDGSWEYVEKTCGPSMMYNPISMVCDWIKSVIQIKPYCGEEEFTIAPPSKCPPGEVWSDCALPCGRACHYYGKLLLKKKLCHLNSNICEAGCVDFNAAMSCPLTSLWRDKGTCVELANCPCMSYSGEMIRPNEVFEESECKVCQCLDNSYVCTTKASCLKGTTPIEEFIPEVEPTVRPQLLVSKEPVIIPAKVTPPKKCDRSKLVPMINGANKLPNSAFSASSILGKSFLPHFARLNTYPTGDTSGSWSPNINDQMQYLEVTFPKVTPLYGVVMQGSPIFDQYITRFKILYSHDGGAFHYLTEQADTPQIFDGGIDGNTPVETLFKIPIEAKVVRIYPLKWHGGISIRLELLGCDRTPSSGEYEFEPKEHTDPTTIDSMVTMIPWEITTLKPIIKIDEDVTPLCDDPMGVENGLMSPEQVTASSVKPLLTAPEQPKLIDLLKSASPHGWRPILDSPNEFITFDFLEPRNLTGVKTQGGPNGWVRAFKLLYSPNGFVWNKVLTPEGHSKLFIANQDSNTPKKNYFKHPIQAQFLKIVPFKWQNTIEMKVEPLGCYHPYPVVEETTAVTIPIQEVVKECPVCEGIDENGKLADGTCTCDENHKWNGYTCVDSLHCPCIIGHFAYDVGTNFQSENCEQCVCILGGVTQCKPKKCPPCKGDLRPVQTENCLCLCEPCPEFQRLCPSSGDCIPEILWCNGIEDCQDDEIDCEKAPIVPTQETTIIEIINVTKTCPEPYCPPGMKMKGIDKPRAREMSSMFGGVKTSGNTKLPTKKTPYYPELAQAVVEKPDIEENCFEYYCVPEDRPAITGDQTKIIACPEPECPVAYDVELMFASPTDANECPEYICVPQPEVDSICSVDGLTFHTFDGTDFKYDICSHMLARDLINDDWSITLYKNCLAGNFMCHKELVIRDKVSQYALTFYPDFTVDLNGMLYTVRQLEKSRSIKSQFIISQTGDAILFVSKPHGFWVSYDSGGNIKIGVSAQNIFAVDGLCGYFNNIPYDDKRLPNGEIADDTVMFGDGWYTREIPKADCKPHACANHLQPIALQICSSIKHDIFSACSKVVDYDAFISACLESTCDCLQEEEENPRNQTSNKDSCKCEVLQNFVKECISSKPDIHVDTWRAVLRCEKECTYPFIHRDCYKRRCEPSCDNLGSEDCPVVPYSCFSGCYCPEGTVRKGESCVPVTECRDCVCDSLGHSKYITYDRQNFTFDGNCTYLLTRDVHVPGVHTFQVYATMGDCNIDTGKTKPATKTEIQKAPIKKSCAKSLHILHGNHIIHFERDNVTSWKTIIDGMEVESLPMKNDWILVQEERNHELSILLLKSQVEVISSMEDMSFSIRVPSVKYGAHMEGLCGDCDGNPNDDLQINPTYKKYTEGTLKDIIDSWQADEPMLGLPEQQCVTEEEYIYDCLPLPAETDPCMKILDADLFGKCHLIIEPLMYVESCQEDMCTPGASQAGACNMLAAYARECNRNGICLDWRTPNFCAFDCPAYMHYEACGCPSTCDSMKEKQIFDVINLQTDVVIKTSKSDLACSGHRGEGCFCPEGTVLKNNQCILESHCIQCDIDHYAGDKWLQDKCTDCECTHEGTTVCTKQSCSLQETICHEGYTVDIIENPSECCPKYNCVPLPTTPPPLCDDPQLLTCGHGQQSKLTKGSDGCPQYVCECVPISECEYVNTPRPIEDGELVEMDTSGCCPKPTIVCNKEYCSPKLTGCHEEFYEVVEKKDIEKCCPVYQCEPPKHSCIVTVDGHKILKSYGEKWKNPLEPCITKLCTYGPDGNLVELEETEVCDTSKCDKGFKLVIQPGECCGTCVQDACIVDNVVYDKGENWYSDDNCTTFSCVERDNQFYIHSAEETCPDLSDCAPELRYHQGCCTLCKLVPESQLNCLPVTKVEELTMGLIQAFQKGHGICTNTEAVRGLTECQGTCSSGTKFNVDTFSQDKYCDCCNVNTYDAIMVTLVCNDGFQFQKEIKVPSSCSCTACAVDKPAAKSVKGGRGVKG